MIITKERPIPDKQLGKRIFCDFYLKYELMNFCRAMGLPSSDWKFKLQNCLQIIRYAFLIQAEVMEDLIMTNVSGVLPARSKYKIVNRNTLKYIAILAMVFDHIAVFFLNNLTVGYGICRTIGRFTASIMCFFIVEGFYYTRSKRKYGIRLGLFALISQPAYTFANCGTLLTFKLISEWNVMFALFMGFLVLLCYEKITEKLLKWLAIFALCCISFISDWGVVAPLWILFFYVFRNNAVKRNILFGSVAIIEIAYAICLMSVKQIPLQYGLWHLGLFLVIPLLLTYNGEKGRDGSFNKWIFYIFYPLQFIIFGLIKMI